MNEQPPNSQNTIRDSPRRTSSHQIVDSPESYSSSQRRFTPTVIASQLLSQFGKKNFCYQDSYSQCSEEVTKRLDQLAQTLRKNNTFNQYNGELGHTNSVLINTSNNEDIELFLPGYMRMRIRNLIKVDVGSGETQVNARITFSIHYGKLPRLFVDYLKQSLILRFSKKNCVLLKQTQEENLSIKVIQEDSLQLITFDVDLPLTFHFQPYYPIEGWKLDMSIWFSPFQKIQNVLTITVQDLVVRFDDMLVEFSGVYDKKEFQQVEDYFKHLKNYNGEIRKLIVKTNLMNLTEPNLYFPNPENKNSKKKPNSSRKNQNQRQMDQNDHQYSIRSVIKQKYRQMVRIANGIEQPTQQEKKMSPEEKTKSDERKFYRVEEQLMRMLKYGSQIRFTYEQEHLLGSYEIVPSQMRVRFSCYMYFGQKQKERARNKLYYEIKNGMHSKKKKRLVGGQNSDLPSQQAPMLMGANRDSVSENEEIVNPGEISFARINREESNDQSETSAMNVIDSENMIEEIVAGIKSTQEGPKAYQYAHYELSIYKHPFVSLAIVFFPLWIISVVNLNIYFSPMDLNNRIANVATLLISYIAYIPIFRQQVPEYRYLLLSQIFAFLQIFCSFLTLIHSLIGSDSDKKLNIEEVGPLFWISFSITVFTFLTVLIAYIVFKCAIEPKYKRKKNTKLPSQALRHILWNNFQCDFAYLKKDKLRLLSQCVSFDDFQSVRNSKDSLKAKNALVRIQKIQSHGP